MIGVVTADISDASILIEVSSEAVASVEIGAVTQGYPGSTQDMIVVSINRGQSEVIVEWIQSESFHDCEHRDTVTPDIARDIIDLLTIDDSTKQIDWGG